MIDFLSNPQWIDPQIDFLLYLQNLRIEHSELINKFFLLITILGEYWLPTLICAVVYWCIDFRAGVYLFTLESFNVLLVHFFKMAACVYRPWVLNNSIHPSELAVPYAKGYSFPSGHSAMTCSVIGGAAYLLRRNKILCTFLAGIVLLVGFSRLWLGVHTPQDVICGLLTGVILIFAVNALINRAEKNKNIYMYLLAAVNIAAAAALIYIKFFNYYKLDYEGGNLLVDPVQQMYTAYKSYAYALGLINGCFICRRFFPFNPKENTVKELILRGALGAVILILLLKYLLSYIFINSISLKYAVIIMFIIGLYVTLIYPLIFNLIQNRRK